MNTVTQNEARAIATAVTLEVADPTKNLILIPLSQLLPRRSKRNVRTTLRLSIPELAASISRIGLLQNLVVIIAANGEQYEVVAGDRRLTALKLLAKKKRIAADYEVPCLLVADASARTISLAENVLREQMHPADQFEAFAALVKEGRPVEDIAADFGVSPLVVQRRLKLANVSPRLLADYRAASVTLEQLMALTITDDHTAQEAAFYGAPEWQRGASALRERLTEREIDASHPLVRFVGLDAYTAAGGGIRRDLFTEGDSGTYLTDATLLERLVRGKLDEQAEAIHAEGWAWVEAVPHMSHADRQMFQNAPRQRREPTTREARRIASLQNRLDKIDAELEEAYDTEDEDRVAALEPRREQVAGELQAVEDALQGYTSDVRAVAGAIVTIDRNGEAVIHRGLLREAEAKALRTLERLRQGFAGTEGANGNEGEDAEPVMVAASLSDRLAQRLGPRTELEIQRTMQREVNQERWTSLDRTLQREAVDDGLVRIERFAEPRLRRQRQMLIGRLQYLQRMGLTAEQHPGMWAIRAEAEPTLRAMGERGDIIRTMQRAMRGLQRELAVFEPGNDGRALVGRVASKGLADELYDKGYLIVDGTDGKAYYVALPLRLELEQYPTGAVVEVKGAADVRAADRNIAALAVDGIYRTDHHLAVAQGQATPERDPREVVAAHVRRLEALRRAGIAERQTEGVWRIPDDLAERGRQYDEQRLGGGVAVELKSHLPIDRQTRVIGATWLDQQLIGGGINPSLVANV